MGLALRTLHSGRRKEAGKRARLGEIEAAEKSNYDTRIHAQPTTNSAKEQRKIASSAVSQSSERFSPEKK